MGVQVPCVKQIKNPIALARRVLDYGEHVLLVGDRALAFAQFCEMKTYPEDYFITEARIQQSMESNVDDTIERGPYPKHFFMGLSWYHTEIGKGISFTKMKADDKPEHISLGDLAINHIRFRILEELIPGDRP
jgi:Asparaginase